jgi:hypothetical protein
MDCCTHFGAFCESQKRSFQSVYGFLAADDADLPVLQLRHLRIVFCCFSAFLPIDAVQTFPYNRS